MKQNKTKQKQNITKTKGNKKKRKKKETNKLTNQISNTKCCDIICFFNCIDLFLFVSIYWFFLNDFSYGFLQQIESMLLMVIPCFEGLILTIYNHHLFANIKINIRIKYCFILMLERTKVGMENWKSRDTGNIGYKAQNEDEQQGPHKKREWTQVLGRESSVCFLLDNHRVAHSQVW